MRPAILAVAVFGLAMTTRLIAFDVALTADEGDWMQRVVRFGAAVARGNADGTYRTGHPGVTVTWIGLLGIGPQRLAPLATGRYIQAPRLQRALGYLEALTAARLGIVVATSVLASLIVLLTCELVGSVAGMLGGLLLLLDPYVVGTSRVLHVDALLPSLMTVSALAGLLYWIGGRSGRWPYLVLSAFAGGLALLTKSPAIFVALYFGLVGLATARPWRGPSRHLLLAIGTWGGIAAAVYVALWPALWVDPIGRLGDLVEFARTTGGAPHERGSYFFGRALAGDPGPLFYPVTLAFRLGPIATVGLLALAVVLLAGARRHRSLLAPAGWLAVYAILFVTMMSLGVKKLDRYLLPALMPLTILAGVGLWLAVSRLLRGNLAAVALGLVVVGQAGLLSRAYPYPLAAYNPLLGGTAVARQVMVVGWGEGLEQVAAYLNARPDAARLDVALTYDNVLRPRFSGTTVSDLPYVFEGPGQARPPVGYFVVYVNSAQRELVPSLIRQAVEDGSPDFTAYVHGVPYAWLYRAPDLSERASEQSVPLDDDPDERRSPRGRAREAVGPTVENDRFRASPGRTM
ncbi:MAG: glycosyltransferase family 39 protein [Chloroflexota bacterium]|nr:glycosyltransferase family 39 protein [Chloroflexota bacterium]